MFISTAITLFIDYNRNKNNYISNIFNKVLGHVVRKHEKIKPMSASYLMFISTILILLIPENMKSHHFTIYLDSGGKLMIGKLLFQIGLYSVCDCSDWCERGQGGSL